MNAVELIEKKRDGKVLADAEISWLIEKYVKGQVPDYQMAAWCMAVYFRGMTAGETAALTKAMAASGPRADLSSIPGIKVDKHSTGGVGDTVTLAAAPIAAAAGVPIAKMSGRSLGFTGGTADKLSAIPGYQTEMAFPDFVEDVRRHGIAMISQSGTMCPADALLYALRDTTGTVESLPLIASSIMSKKIASGADAIVLDVKCGRGAFMKSQADAEALMHAMMDLGEHAGIRMAALVTDMNVPLGMAIGNSLEVDEAVEILSGGGGKRLAALTLSVAGAMIYVGGKAESFEEGKSLARQLISTGKAMDKLKECIAAQHGKTDWIGNHSLTPETWMHTVLAEKEGYIEDVDPLILAHTVMELGGGRVKKEDMIDLHVGVLLLKEAGEKVRRGDPLLKIYGSEEKNPADFARRAAAAIAIGDEKKEFPLIYEMAGLGDDQ